jgi:hypothetical protein
VDDKHLDVEFRAVTASGNKFRKQVRIDLEKRTLDPLPAPE